jgi:hypothetical protein
VILETEASTKFLNFLGRDILAMDNSAKKSYSQHMLASVYAEIRGYAKKIYTKTNTLLDSTATKILDAAKESATATKESELDLYEKRCEWCERVGQLAANLMNVLDIELSKHAPVPVDE